MLSAAGTKNKKFFIFLTSSISSRQYLSISCSNKVQFTVKLCLPAPRAMPDTRSTMRRSFILHTLEVRAIFAPFALCLGFTCFKLSTADGKILCFFLHIVFVKKICKFRRLPKIDWRQQKQRDHHQQECQG